jgi:hypothetical protein
MASMFLSYRRTDSEAETGRLSDGLRERFGRSSVFLDLAELVPGEDYRAAIERTVRSCKALIAVIGPQWSSVRGPDGSPRISDPDDIVRLEIATALARNLQVFPVLIGGASMPLEAELPDDVAKLAAHHAISLSNAHWTRDFEVLSVAICKQVPELRWSSGRRWRIVSACAIFLIVAGFWLSTVVPSRVLAEGPYDCETDGQALSRCTVSRQVDGSLTLEFFGSDHSESLTNRFHGAVNRSKGGLTILVTNEFSADPGANLVRNESRLDLRSAGSQTWEGVWHWADAEHRFRLSHRAPSGP